MVAVESSVHVFDAVQSPVVVPPGQEVVPGKNGMPVSFSELASALKLRITSF